MLSDFQRSAMGSYIRSIMGVKNSPIGIKRRFLGSQKGTSVATITLANIQTYDNEFVVVMTANYSPFGSFPSCTYNGNGLSNSIAISNGPFNARIFFGQITDDTLGDIEFATGFSSPSLVLLAFAVKGLQQNGSGCGTLDRSEGTFGNGTTPDSDLTAPTAPSVIVFGLVATNGPLADVDGAWDNGLLTGEKDGTALATAADNTKIMEGYKITSDEAEYRSKKTGITNRDWISIVNSFK